MAKIHPLDRYMIDHNLNIDQLAEKLDLQRSLLYRIIGGKGCMLRTALRIAQATDYAVSVDELASSLKPEPTWRPDKRRVGQRRYEQRS